MLDPRKRRYLYFMLAGFGAISLSILLFLMLDRMETISAALDNLLGILAPFGYGGVVAYLLRPLCNHYERILTRYLPQKLQRAANPLAVGLSLVSGILIVYALIIMIAPQLYESVLTLWNSLPEKIDQFLNWAIATFGEDEEFLHRAGRPRSGRFARCCLR